MDAAAKKANPQPELLPTVTSFGIVKANLPVQQRFQQAIFLRKVEQVLSSNLMPFGYVPRHRPPLNPRQVTRAKAHASTKFQTCAQVCRHIRELV